MEWNVSRIVIGNWWMTYIQEWIILQTIMESMEVIFFEFIGKSN